MTAEQSTFMIDLHQVGMMLRYTEKIPEGIIISSLIASFLSHVKSRLNSFDE